MKTIKLQFSIIGQKNPKHDELDVVLNYWSLNKTFMEQNDFNVPS